MDRQQPNYEPRPEIARLQSFNAMDGFYSHHVKWFIDKLPRNPDVISESFKTDKDEEQLWKLRFYTEDNSEPSIYFMRSIDDKDPEIPVIVRVKLMNETEGIIEYSSSTAFLLTRSFWLFDWRIPNEIMKKLSKTDCYVVHCWMDIPKKFNGNRNSGGQNSGPALLSSSLACSFEKVMDKNGDPTSDIELVIKDGTDDPPRFYCHRHILATRSPVFEMMFANDRFKESNERVVEIEDMSAKALKLLLRYMYTGEVTKKLRKDRHKRLILSLLNAAEKYMLPELKDECAFVLIGGGNGECNDAEWIEYLQLAETFNLEYLRKVCILALSTNMRSLGEERVRGLVSPRSMTELLEMVTKRAEITRVIQVKTDD